MKKDYSDLIKKIRNRQRYYIKYIQGYESNNPNANIENDPALRRLKARVEEMTSDMQKLK